MLLAVSLPSAKCRAGRHPAQRGLTEAADVVTAGDFELMPTRRTLPFLSGVSNAASRDPDRCRPARHPTPLSALSPTSVATRWPSAGPHCQHWNLPTPVDALVRGSRAAHRRRRPAWLNPRPAAAAGKVRIMPSTLAGSGPGCWPPRRWLQETDAKDAHKFPGPPSRQLTRQPPPSPKHQIPKWVVD